MVKMKIPFADGPSFYIVCALIRKNPPAPPRVPPIVQPPPPQPSPPKETHAPQVRSAFTLFVNELELGLT